jgi:hypothetical protein
VNRAVLALLAGLVLAPASARAQGCCTPGTSPLAGLSGVALTPGAIEVGLTADAYELRQAYQGGTRTADPARRHSSVQRVLVWARVGLPAEAVFIVEAPWESRMREQPQPLAPPGTTFRLTGRGAGDIATSVVIRAFPRGRPASWGVNAGAGVKWGTGSVDRTQDGLHLPVELQSGTGSTDPLLLLSAHRLWSSAGLTLGSAIRFPTEGRNDYRYGTETHATLFGWWAPRPAWAAGAELRVRAAAVDQFRDVDRASTGGWRLLAGPRAFARWERAGIGFEGAVLWPLRQSLHGLQIGVDREVLLGLRWTP